MCAFITDMQYWINATSLAWSAIPQALWLPSSAYVIYGSPPRASTSARAPLRRLHSPLSDRCKSRPSRAARSFLVPSTTEPPRPVGSTPLTHKMSGTDSRGERSSEREKLRKLNGLLFLVTCSLLWTAATAAPRDLGSNGKLRLEARSSGPRNGDGTVELVQWLNVWRGNSPQMDVTQGFLVLDVGPLAIWSKIFLRCSKSL